jgi:hypothetical protein
MTRKEAKDLLKALPGESAILSLMRLKNERGDDAFMIGLTCEPHGATASHAGVMDVERPLHEQFVALRSDFLDIYGRTPIATEGLHGGGEPG